jgi:hypothetical protein
MTTQFEFDRARANLHHFVLRTARNVARSVGFSYEEREDAPDTLQSIREAFLKSRNDRSGFPVYAGASDKTIYLSPEGNWAFRFWHDILHVIHASNTTFEDEVKLGWLHVQAVEKEFGKGSLEARIMGWDTVGQSAYHVMMGNFPEDQREFVFNALTRGANLNQWADMAYNGLEVEV